MHTLYICMSVSLNNAVSSPLSKWVGYGAKLQKKLDEDDKFTLGEHIQLRGTNNPKAKFPLKCMFLSLNNVLKRKNG